MSYDADVENSKQVLDHGYVWMVGKLGDDNTVLERARMSTDKPTGVDLKADEALRRRLWFDEHTSPFEMCELVFELKLPKFCLVQIDRHRTIQQGDNEIEIISTIDDSMHVYSSRNEFSGRYSVMPDEYYIPTKERISGKNLLNKQGSGSVLSEDVKVDFLRFLETTVEDTRIGYDAAVESGVANELCRLVLPQNQYTRVTLKANLLNWFKFLRLRLKPDVQWETRQYAEAIAYYIRTHFPKSYSIFEEKFELDYILTSLYQKKNRPLLLEVLNFIYIKQGQNKSELEEIIVRRYRALEELMKE